MSPWPSRLPRAAVLALALGVLAPSGCVLIGSTSPSIDYGPALESYGAAGLDAYTVLDVDATALSSALETLCAEPDEARLMEARAAWRATHASWRRTAAFALGPAVTTGFDADLAFFPARTTSIETNLRTTDPITDASVAELGAAGTGLFAMEHLLFPPADTASDETLTALGDERRCAYLAALGRHGAALSSELHAAWAPDGESYATRLAGGAHAATMSAVVTRLVAATQILKLQQLGKPLGLSDGGTPQPDDVEGRLAEDAVAAARATLAGLRAAWGDPESASTLRALVEGRNAELATRVDAALTAADLAIAALSEPLATHLSGEDLARMVAAYDATRAIERLLLSEVSSTLGVMVSLTDSDGD